MSKHQKEVGGLYELSDSGEKIVKNSKYYNEDLAPTKLKERTWGTYHIATLWVGMAVCIPTYMMASGLMAAGLSWWQALLNIMIGNLIVLIPMQLNSHAGTKYGIPFPVFARLSFGPKGAHLASIARAIVAAGWFGIQCWIGGAALDTVVGSISASWAAWAGSVWVSFFIFWGFSVFIAWKGPDAIKSLESWGAPLLGVLTACLVIWAIVTVKNMGGTVGDIFNLPATYVKGQFWRIFLPGLGGNIAFWATLALNIPDFSRYAKTQRQQFMGQLLGLPTTMTLFAFAGVLVTGATKIIFGEFIWDPTGVIARLGSPVAAILGAVGVVVATMTTNIAANVVAPANGISNISPKRLSYRIGALITGVLGVAIMPWRLLSSAGAYIFGWLGTYGLFLGPLAGIYVADYYIFRKKKLDLTGLFQGDQGRYWYKNGFNWKAVLTWAICGFVVVLGKIFPDVTIFARLTENGILVGFILAVILYPLMMKSDSSSLVSDEEEASITER
ncbi:MAG: NCS1 family nucleobase:cation symporter-1 [Spirochaetales bacterium]|uniref:NCS1 family nucleobase:cation symporter-1 n=1 Tax=Candidatus Thalassospirochaeta sargassi TaxID=3119039 RepID=A0AAJ1IIZ1_9SPIO|nr:NCS1 family nucleobase:cation symporter-1 [Spirochaetales bacterium]